MLFRSPTCPSRHPRSLLHDQRKAVVDLVLGQLRPALEHPHKPRHGAVVQLRRLALAQILQAVEQLAMVASEPERSARISEAVSISLTGLFRSSVS